MTRQVDMFVIGGGSAGVRTARVSAARGKKVVLAEEYRMGGTCVIRGCVPKKLYVYASEFGPALQDAKGFGWDIGESKHSWAALKNAKDAEINRLEGIYDGMLERAGVEVVSARATITGPNEVLCDGVTYKADYIIVCVGGTPFVPPFEGNEFAVSSDDVFQMSEIPDDITILGGGYIALEFAHIFRSLGRKVTIVYRGHEVLRGFDSCIRREVTELTEQRGIKCELNTEVSSIEQKDDGLTVTCQNGDTFATDMVMAATGRTPSTRNLGLVQAGVETEDNGTIKVNEHLQTSVPSIYALGDCANTGPNLTPVAIAQAKALVSHLWDKEKKTLHYESLSTAIFCQPPAATAGLTEDEAAASGEIEVYDARFTPMKNILAGRKEKAYLKLIVDKDSRKVLGAHMIGPDAPEIIQCIAIAITGGMTKDQFDQTLPLHPSTAEEFVLMSTPRDA